MGFDENRISFIDDRPGHDFRYAASNNNLIRTGWKPQYNFDESLKEIIHWYMKNTKWWNKSLLIQIKIAKRFNKLVMFSLIKRIFIKTLQLFF